MATLREWYEKLPSPVREQAIANATAQDANVDIITTNSMFHAINKFQWSITPQGHDYWAEIAQITDNADGDWVDKVLKVGEELKAKQEREQALIDSIDLEVHMEPKSALDWFYIVDEPLRYRLIKLYTDEGNRFHVKHSSMYRVFQEMCIPDDLVPMKDEYRIIHRFTEQRRREIEEERERQRLERIKANQLHFSTSFAEMIETINCKVARILRDKSFHDSSFANYITMRSLMVSFLPAGREHKTNSETGRWLRDGRQEMKIAKIAKRLIHPDELKMTNIELNEQHFEEFANEVKSYISINGDEDGEGKNLVIEIVEGEEIRKAYHDVNYSKILGTDSNLWNSCMRYDQCQKYLGMFVNNPEVCKLLVARDPEGKVLGRALLWDGKCMDTIYAHESIRKAFINWAKENEYRYKSQQSCHHHVFDLPITEDYKLHYLEVELKRSGFDYYPYMDTMRYLEGSTLHNDSDGCWDYELRYTDGRRDEDDDEDDDDGRVYCEWNGESYDEDDVRYVDYTRPNGRRLQSYVHYEDVVTLSSGDVVLEEDAVETAGGAWYLKDDEYIRHSERDNCYYHVDDCAYLEYLDDYVDEDDAETCEHDGLTYLRKDMEEVENADGETVWVYTENLEDYLQSIKTEENA